MSDNDSETPLLPARMLNEYAYCPRLAYLEWVQGEFAHSADTLDGAWKHRRVDRATGDLPAADGEEASEGSKDESEREDAIHARSVHLSSVDEGLTAVVDLIEGTKGSSRTAASVTPVDYKRGEVPDVPERAWEADRVQLCAQGLVLRSNGYRCERGVVYYAASKTRVTIPFDEDLVEHTRELVKECRSMVRSERMPPPLSDSHKCPRCSLVGICLPDETNLLSAVEHQTIDKARSQPVVRRLVPSLDETRPLYVQEQGAYVSKNGESLVVRGPCEKGSKQRPVLGEIRLGELSNVALFGRVQISTEAVHALMDAEIPVTYFSWGAWFRGITTSLPSKNIDLRRCQFATSENEEKKLSLARGFVQAKIENQRTLLRRNGAPDESTLREMKDLAGRASKAGCVETLLGLEGNAARFYFQSFETMIKPRSEKPGSGEQGFAFSFEKRNRRPPEDPVNALLSFTYAVLARELTIACWTSGLDPFLGFFHKPRFGRPALALDLMEEFRPVIADSVVITAVNTGVVQPSDFMRRGPAVALTPDGRRRFLKAYERRMDSLVTHPVFGYKISYRRVLEVQARLLGRALLGELSEYPSFLVR